MDVEILNPEVLETLYKNHGEFARVCYDTPAKYAEKVGKACESSGHMSGSRCEYIKFRLTGVDRGTAEQCMRHEIGVRFPIDDMDNYSFADYSEKVTDVDSGQIVKNMASFRYIDKGGFEYIIPKEIEEDDNLSAGYKDLMSQINEMQIALKQLLLEKGVDKRRAVECANFVLPRCTTSTLTVGFTPEALIHFMHKRLCVRAQPEIRAVAIAMRNKVAEFNEEFSKDLVPHCQHLMWCPEGSMCCGARPTKEQLKAILKNNKSEES